jgi:hypothetical protein
MLAARVQVKHLSTKKLDDDGLQLLQGSLRLWRLRRLRPVVGAPVIPSDELARWPSRTTLRDFLWLIHKKSFANGISPD